MHPTWLKDSLSSAAGCTGGGRGGRDGTETDAHDSPFAPWKGREVRQEVENTNLSQLCAKYEVLSLIWALIFFVFPLAKWDQVRQPGSLGGLRNVKPFLFLSNCIE